MEQRLMVTGNDVFPLKLRKLASNLTPDELLLIIILAIFLILVAIISFALFH